MKTTYCTLARARAIKKRILADPEVPESTRRKGIAIKRFTEESVT